MTDPTIPPPAPISTPTGPATTAEWRAENENIGPVYRFGGYLLLLCDLAVVGLLAYKGTPVAWPIAIVLLLFGFSALLMIRPPGLDNFVKTVADRLPFVPYQKPPS